MSIEAFEDLYQRHLCDRHRLLEDASPSPILFETDRFIMHSSLVYTDPINASMRFFRMLYVYGF